MQDLSGQKLGQYELRQRLGRGGMAEVYKAYQPGMDRFVAIKVMLGHLATDADFVERFRREAQAVGRLRHPHIVNVFDFGTTEDVYYMAMEFIQGETLKAYILRKQRLEPMEALRITSQIADALEYAHGAGMIHRDLKPANIMFIDQDNQHSILTDFGIARILGQAGLTASGAMVGTPAYISPEAARGEATDARADLYGLGVILYEMLTGRVPFDADTPLAIVLKHINAPLPTRQDYGETIPEPVERLILKSLTKNPDDRFQSAAEMKASVGRALEELESTAPTDVRTPATEAASPSPTTSGADEEMRGETVRVTPAPMRKKRRSPILTYGAVAVVVIAVLAVIAIVLGGGGDEADDQTPETEVAAVQTEATEEAQVALETDVPAEEVTEEPTEAPTDEPSETPTDEPSETPSEEPADTPTDAPTDIPGPTQVAQLPPESGISLLSNISPVMNRVEEMALAGAGDAVIEFLDAELGADPENVDALVARSLWLSAEGDGEGALETAQEAVELAPDSTMPLLALSDALITWPNESHEEAVGAVFRALEIDPDNPQALWRLSRFQRDFSEYEQALQTLNESIDRGAGGPQFINYAGEFFYDLTDYERAIPYLQTLTGTMLDDPYIRMMLMGALIQTGQESQAFVLAQDTASGMSDPFILGNLAYVAYRSDEIDQAREWAETARALSSDAGHATYVLALIAAYTDDDTGRAVELLESLGDEFDGWPFLYEEFGHERNMDMGRILVHGGEIEGAIELYSALIEEQSWRVEPYLERANLYLELGERDLALDDFRGAYRALDHEGNPELSRELQRTLYRVFWDEEPLDLNPEIDAPLTERDLQIAPIAGRNPTQDEVDRLLLDNRPEAAFDFVNSILENEPETHEVLAARARVNLALGDGEEARADAERAIEINPERIDGYLVLIDALLHWSIDDPAAALEVVERANAVDPELSDPGLPWRIAAVQHRLGNHEAAEEMLARAEELGAQGLGYAWTAGEFWFDEEQYERALEPLKTVFVSGHDTYERTLYIRALLYAGQYEVALQAAIQIAPDIRDDPYYFNWLSYAAYRANAPEMARSWARFRIAISPGDAIDARYIDGLISWHLDGELETALETLQWVIDNQQDDNQLAFNRQFGHNALLDTVQILVEMDRVDEARERADIAVERFQYYAPAYETRADLHLMLEDVEAARADLQSALELTEDPDERQRLVDRIVALGPAG